MTLLTYLVRNSPWDTAGWWNLQNDKELTVPHQSIMPKHSTVIQTSVHTCKSKPTAHIRVPQWCKLLRSHKTARPSYHTPHTACHIDPTISHNSTNWPLCRMLQCCVLCYNWGRTLWAPNVSCGEFCWSLIGEKYASQSKCRPLNLILVSKLNKNFKTRHFCIIIECKSETHSRRSEWPTSGQNFHSLSPHSDMLRQFSCRSAHRNSLREKYILYHTYINYAAQSLLVAIITPTFLRAQGDMPIKISLINDS